MPGYIINNTRYVSPNFTKGREKSIGLIVLHATASDTLDSAAGWMCAPHSQVSTHYVVDEVGGIYQLVDDADTAWHAGNSKWGGFETYYPSTKQHSVNEASIGIELVNSNNGKDPYEPAQVAALTWLVEWKARQYGIELDNIVRHLDVAVPSGRKTDPAGFAWATWRKSLTIGNDEKVWDLWGSQFPLYSDQRHYGIPQTWVKHAAVLGEARSWEVGGDDIVVRVFQRGMIVYRNGKTKIVYDNDVT